MQWPCWTLSSTLQEITFKFNHRNRFSYLVVDACLGMLLMCFLIRIELPHHFWSYLHSSIEKLDLLIDWLTQYPAGLKLNDQLNELLAGFFKYHIRLWRTYISTLNSTWCSHSQQYLLAGLAGASLLLAFLLMHSNY
uniref:Uncharacterized protein n=1 Tax=Ditylenchus dipsaci TaxID=166011 RepID=A0A915DI13_9BILA